MKVNQSSFQRGQFVQIKQGRDAGKFAIVIELLDDRHVLLADGQRRTFDRPKKKNIFHLRSLPIISPEVCASLAETGRVTNGKLRYALHQYVDQLNDEEKGDGHDGER